MEDAPRDGSRVLLKYHVYHYKRGRGKVGFAGGQWERDGEKWEEVRWISDKKATGSDPHWEPWRGNPRTRSTRHVLDEDAIGWLPRPEDE